MQEKKGISAGGVIVGIIILILLFSPSDSGGSSGSSSQSGQSSQSSQSAKQTRKADYEVSINSAQIMRYYDDDIIVIEYTFKNNKDDPRSFAWSTSAKVYQDGIELGDAFVIDDKICKSGDSTRDIQAGKSFTFKMAYELRDKKTPVEVIVKKYLSDDELASKTFNIK